MSQSDPLNHLGINLVSIRTFRGPLFPKQESSESAFLETQYSEVATN